jgi:hypothetical protein
LDHCENIEIIGNGNFDQWNVISIGCVGLKLSLNSNVMIIPDSLVKGNVLRYKSYMKCGNYISEMCNDFGDTRK